MAGRGTALRCRIEYEGLQFEIETDLLAAGLPCLKELMK
ncbi:hypothetical protein LCGC14_0274210 [marine sediment metagenome]|uniref:Uncharacterized protein n=1 Tax=marine sediment metagenome TaxID=412755 RepID=A0A0F9U369_9ZZZZ